MNDRPTFSRPAGSNAATRIRAFFALVPDDAVRVQFVDACARRRAPLARARGHGRPRAPDAGVPRRRRVARSPRCARSATRCRSSGDRLEFDALGAWRASGVAWIAPAVVAGAAAALHAALRDALRGAGFALEARAVPAARHAGAALRAAAAARADAGDVAGRAAVPDADPNCGRRIALRYREDAAVALRVAIALARVAPLRSRRARRAQRQRAPSATGRAGSAHHSLHEPGYSRVPCRPGDLPSRACCGTR